MCLNNTTEKSKLITDFVPLNAAYYHPNEICAYIVSNYIINKETIVKLYNFVTHKSIPISMMF